MTQRLWHSMYVCIFVSMHGCMWGCMYVCNMYSESQIYEYKARVFYNVVFSTYLGSNAAEKWVEYINCFPAYFRAINLPWIKNKKKTVP